MIKVEGITVTPGNFPDGTLAVKFDPNQIDKDTREIWIEWIYENDAELFTLICIKRHLERHFYDTSYFLTLPYIPHARMDRVKKEEDVFTLKYFCEVINSLHFSGVYVYDAHSNVSLALLENVIQEPVEEYIQKAIEASKAEALFFPDEGAMKRYSDMATLPFAFGMKKRDWATGQILGLDLIGAENIAGKKVLIVDDICSYGGTFARAAKALREAGAAAVYLYVTHCEDNIHKGDIFKENNITKVYTTPSIYTKTDDEKVFVL